MPAIGGALSDKQAYAYLPRSMAYLPPPERMLAMLVEAGFPTPRGHADRRRRAVAHGHAS
ncbi:MAG: hypothetical protein U0V56_03995 [Actinomycetota bacterium]